MTPVYGTVERAERLTPSLVRVEFGGPGLDDFEPTPHTDQYVNALFIPDGAPYEVPFDHEATKHFDAELRPRGRRYTVRVWDQIERRLTIDFVAHGDHGYAGPWAQRAKPGDQLQFTGPSGGYTPDLDADWYLLAGDESALPAIAASLEVVPAGSRCVVFVVVDDAEHELALTSPGELDVRWLHRSSAPDPDMVLPAAIAAADLPGGRPDVFVHGEAAEVRATRKHLIAERGVDRDRSSISPYWRRDHTDEAWRAIKRQWIAETLQDA